jgi:hypothetical protein
MSFSKVNAISPPKERSEEKIDRGEQNCAGGAPD